MDGPGPSSKDTSEATPPAVPQLSSKDISRIATKVASILRGASSSSHPLTTFVVTGSAPPGK